MFCPNCGTKMPDGAAFCGACGTRMNQASKPVQPARPAQPTRPAHRPTSARTRKPGSMNRDKQVLITMAISLLLILFSIMSVFSTAFYDLPVMSLALMADGARDEVIGDLHDEMDERIEYMEEWIDYAEDFADDDEIEDAEKFLKDVKKLRKNMSFNSFKSYMKAAQKADSDVSEVYYDFVDINEDEASEVKLALNIAKIVVVLFFALPILFTVLGGTKKSVGLTITGMVFTAISQLTLSGLLWVILSLAVGIFQVKLLKRQ